MTNESMTSESSGTRSAIPPAAEACLAALSKRGFQARWFDDRQACAAALLEAIRPDEVVGIGGSMTVEELGVYDALISRGNTVWWHWRTPGFATLDNALTAPVYLSSANAITADGQILNIDGRGNRLAAMVYGIGKTVYIVAGTNKICPDFDSALSRARNTAAVQNMQRFDGDQPCHTAGRCLDCRSKSRGCNALLVLWGQMMDMAKVEVVLIDEPLGL